MCILAGKGTFLILTYVFISEYSDDFFSPFKEEEDMFSDTEASNIEDSIMVVNVSEDKTKSIEIVTLGDSISSDSDTESPKPKKIDENKVVKKNVMTKVEKFLGQNFEKVKNFLNSSQDDETNTGEDNSSMKESSNNDDNPEAANEEVDLDNAAQTSTPDQGRLRPNSQANTSLEDSQALSSENLERKILEAIGNYFFYSTVTYNGKGKT
jgi:hypothetical protein